MVRALARQAEAEREKRAKIIATEGEFQAAQVLANAAEIISTQPAALALRYMQTLLDMGSNQNSTIVFPIPIELIRPLARRSGSREDGAGRQRAVPERRTESVVSAFSQARHVSRRQSGRRPRAWVPRATDPRRRGEGDGSAAAWAPAECNAGDPSSFTANGRPTAPRSWSSTPNWRLSSSGAELGVEPLSGVDAEACAEALRAIAEGGPHGDPPSPPSWRDGWRTTARSPGHLRRRSGRRQSRSWRSTRSRRWRRSRPSSAWHEHRESSRCRRRRSTRASTSVATERRRVTFRRTRRGSSSGRRRAAGSSGAGAGFAEAAGSMRRIGLRRLSRCRRPRARGSKATRDT